VTRDLGHSPSWRRRRLWIWGAPAAVYAAFALWYTNLGGPLGPAEIERHVARLEAIGEPPERVAHLRRFMETDTGRQFLMVNLVDLAERPPDVAGAPPGASPTQLMGRFFDGLYREFASRACHPVFGGRAVHGALDLIRLEGGGDWESAALVRYRSRRDMMEIVPTLLERYELKLAALDKHVAFPVEPQLHPGDPRLLLALAALSAAGLLDLALVRR
jgi:hypothetical protein